MWSYFTELLRPHKNQLDIGRWLLGFGHLGVRGGFDTFSDYDKGNTGLGGHAESPEAMAKGHSNGDLAAFDFLYARCNVSRAGGRQVDRLLLDKTRNLRELCGGQVLWISTHILVFFYSSWPVFSMEWGWGSSPGGSLCRSQGHLG